MYDKYAPPGKPVYANWILQFYVGDEMFTKKRLVTAKATQLHGEIEPVAYLHAFRDLFVSGVIVNARDAVPRHYVSDQVLAHRAEFEALVASFSD